MQTTDDGVMRSPASTPVWATAVAVVAVSLAAGQASAQEPAWRSTWGLTLQTRYDDNPLRLNEWEKANLNAGLPQFEGIEQAYDVLNTIRVQGVFRGPGIAGRPLRLGADVPIAAYTFSRRRLQLSINGSASQKLSSHNEVETFLTFTPLEVQRNFLTGVNGSGEPVYAEGAGRRLLGGVGFTREILDGKHGPGLETEISAQAGRRTFSDFPWRNRTELGGRIGLNFEPVDALQTELSATRTRTRHASLPEPVREGDGVTVMATRRDFVDLGLEAEAGLRLVKENRLVVAYERRNRSYVATLAEDPVYGDRRDHRDAYRAEFRLQPAPFMGLTFGGSLEDQSKLQPGSGDTGDEADYRRNTLFLSLTLLR